jgi:beta-N-acetylhexosaminidase
MSPRTASAAGLRSAPGGAGLPAAPDERRADVYDRDRLRHLAASVLLPATDASALPPGLEGFLRAGGRSVLLGESRAEYVARRMDDDRRARETPERFRALTAAAGAAAGAPCLVALDQELGGIQRAHALVPALPSAAEAASLPDDALLAACGRTARGLRELGVGLVLGPVVDLVDGPQPWLDGRHHGADAAHTARLAARFVRAFEAAGVATCPKHFPGHRGLTTDPAVDEIAVVPASRAALVADLAPFRAALWAGASAAMVGPATVPALDPDLPALLSPAVVGLLRGELGFGGLVVSDDLDAASVLRGRTLAEAAVAALRAGNDLLLVSAENDLPALVEALVAGVVRGDLPAGRLAAAARRVAALADRVGASPGR